MPFSFHTWRQGLAALMACAGLAAVALPAQAAGAYPDKPVKLVVNFAPGGAADQIARALGVPLQQALGQPVVIENRSGAGGNVGGEAVARAQPDGYTLLMSSGGMVSINPAIYHPMSFDPAKDLVPVASAARVMVYLMVKPDFPARTARDFIAYAKANPGRLAYGSPGNGSSPHLAGEMFNQATGVVSTHVPYRGAAPALQDLLGGQIQYLFDPGIGLQHVRAGGLRLLAVGSLHRSEEFKDVPTLDEAGLKGFDADTYFGVYAPAGTPAAVVSRLHDEINRIVASPDFRERMVAMGGAPAPMTAAEFTQRFGQLIRERGIRGD
ncbi:MAG: hypothetical protein GAK30_00774 [Paracidovorax wautersii]|uniref:Tripartite-type tricarboxylate transporter, receptor component TctC n=1 Tax=Paracidovorax wautersii TaxID=1177982 RepID=A0A7V8FR75_9BURK|nr:MAG: hypothetical protein GAK30_00774 [Paracidovorax wautersii]